MWPSRPRAAVDPDRPHAEYVSWLLSWGAPDGDIRESYHEVPKAERHLVVGDLTARGMSARQIADLLEITMRSVTRHRATARDDNPVGPADDYADDVYNNCVDADEPIDLDDLDRYDDTDDDADAA